MPEAIRQLAKIFHQEPLKNYYSQLNEHAAMLAENDPFLLANLGVQLQKQGSH